MIEGADAPLPLSGVHPGVSVPMAFGIMTKTLRIQTLYKVLSQKFPGH
jgi:hypothetical protein